jgi:hypothetical protein
VQQNAKYFSGWGHHRADRVSILVRNEGFAELTAGLETTSSPLPTVGGLAFGLEVL